MPSDTRATRLSRRRMLQVGAAGAASIWLGGHWRILEDVASAASLPPELRRSTWLGVTDPGFQAAAGKTSVPLELLEVADLPIAAEIPGLRDHDGAFAIRFSGPTGVDQGTWRLRNAELGDIELFVVPIEGAGEPCTYEVIVDRTIRIAGINEEGEPKPVEPGDRGAQPAATRGPGQTAPSGATAATAGASRTSSPAAKTPGPTAGTTRRTVTPRVRRAVLARSASGRTALADLALADAGSVASVRGLLLSHGKVVGTASASRRRSQHVRLRFASKRRLEHGRYELLLTLIGRDGHVTRVRRHVRIS